VLQQQDRRQVQGAGQVRHHRIDCDDEGEAGHEARRGLDFGGAAFRVEKAWRRPGGVQGDQRALHGEKWRQERFGDRAAGIPAASAPA
jgi:hypothetical protein